MKCSTEVVVDGERTEVVALHSEELVEQHSEVVEVAEVQGLRKISKRVAWAVEIFDPVAGEI